MQLAFEFMVWPTNPSQLWSLTVTGAFFYCDCLTSGKFCMSKHSCSFIIIVPWNNIQKRLLHSIFFYAEKALASVHLHRLTWVFVLVLKYHVLAQITIYVPFIITVNAVVRLHQQPLHILATISALYQCVKKCSQCVVIKFLIILLASLPRKKIQSGYRFLDVITCKYDNSCA